MRCMGWQCGALCVVASPWWQQEDTAIVELLLYRYRVVDYRIELSETLFRSTCSTRYEEINCFAARALPNDGLPSKHSTLTS